MKDEGLRPGPGKTEAAKPVKAGRKSMNSADEKCGEVRPVFAKI